MPLPTIDSLQTKEAALKKRLTEQGPSMDPLRRRAAQKRLRRMQRRRRGMQTEAIRRAPKKTADAAAPAAAPEAASGE